MSTDILSTVSRLHVEFRKIISGTI